MDSSRTSKMLNSAAASQNAVKILRGRNFRETLRPLRLVRSIALRDETQIVLLDPYSGRTVQSAISRNRRVIGDARSWRTNDAISRSAIFANVIVPSASIVRPRGAYLIVAIFAAESRRLSNNAGVDKGTRGFREMQLIRGRRADVTRLRG